MKKNCKQLKIDWIFFFLCCRFYFMSQIYQRCKPSAKKAKFGELMSFSKQKIVYFLEIDKDRRDIKCRAMFL